MAIETDFIKILELTALALPIWPIWSSFEVNGLDWQYCLAGSSKAAPRIFIFSILQGAEYSSYAKSVATFALAFLGILFQFQPVCPYTNICG